MADIYLDHDTKRESLTAQLPSFMPTDPESGNYKFFSAIAERLESQEADVDSISRASSVLHADSLDQLERLAKFVDVVPYQNETREHFRARVIAEFQLLTSTGSVGDVLNATATILEAEVEDIGYSEDYTAEAGNVRLTIPLSNLKSTALSSEEFKEIGGQLLPAGYRLDVLNLGTFTYISPEEYLDSNFVHDADLGYDGLDSGGNPKDAGGTYAGVL